MIEMTSDVQLPSQFAPVLFFFFIYFLIGGKSLYDVVLASATQQCKSAPITCVAPPSWVSLPSPPLWVITECQAGLPVLDSSTSSVQSSSVAQSCPTLCDPHGPQHARPPCPSPAPRPKPMSIESVMPSNHLILCHPLLLPLSIFPSIRVFSNESVLHIRWPKYWSFSFNISPSNEHPGLISFRVDWLDLLAVQGLSRVFSNTTVQKHQFFSAQLSSQSNSHIHTWLLEK